MISRGASTLINWASQCREVKCPKEGRGRLDSAFQEAIGVSGTIPRIEVEITDLPTYTSETVREFCQQGPEMQLRLSMTERTYRGIRKAYVLPEESRALKLLKAAHIKIGWVSCRVRRKMETNRCYRCLGFGHMAADCWGSDRCGSCWKFSEEGHTAGTCTRSPRCYLCTVKEEKPQVDYMPCTMESLEKSRLKTKLAR